MFLKKLDGLMFCPERKLAYELLGAALKAKNVGIRGNHSVRRDRKPHGENDSGIIDPNLSMWRSINSEHKEVEQIPTDQTESIMNYYKDRWIQEHKEKKNIETISGAEVTTDTSDTEKKSLYSQLARKAQTKAHSMRMGNMGHMGNMHMGMVPEDPAMMLSYDPFKLQKNPPLHDASPKDRIQNSRHDSAPGFWSSERTPYNFATPASGQSDFHQQQQQRIREMKPDPNGPYRPSFSMADLVGPPKSESTAKTEKQETSAPPDIKPSKTMKEETNDETNNSFSYKPAPPPVPDFKSM